jgi:hypothetical protein
MKGVLDTEVNTMLYLAYKLRNTTELVNTQNT